MHTISDPEIDHFPSETSNLRFSATLGVISPKSTVQTLSFFIIITNILAFVVLNLFGWIMEIQYQCVLYSTGALYPPDLNRFQWHKLVTASFFPASFLQLLINSFSALMVSFEAEEVLGREKFLILYLGSSIYGFLLFCVGNPGNMISGSSAAVMGIMGSFTVRMLLKLKQVDYKFAFLFACILFINLLMALASSTDSFLVFIGGFISGALFTLILQEETERIESMGKWKLWSKCILCIYPIICIIGFLMLEIQYFPKC